jgi:hypothetical protein
MSKLTQKYQVYCDMDGVLCDYMGSVLTVMNETVKKISDNVNLYKTKYNKFYKSARKAVAEQGGDLDNRSLGEVFLAEHVEHKTTRRQVRNFMYSCVFNNYEFWRDMPWMADGQELWEFIKPHRPIVLSGPQGPNSKIGKKDWVCRELGLGRDKVILTQTKHEEAIKQLKEGRIAILIDDLPKYVVPFRNAGGIAIHHSSAKESIAQLKELGFK